MRVVALVIAVAALAGGCGGDDSNDTAAPSTERAQAESRGRAEPPHPPASGLPLRFLRSPQTAGFPDERLTEAARAVLPTDVEVWKRLAWEEVYPHLPAEYRSPECRAGGVLDREPDTPEFP